MIEQTNGAAASAVETPARPAARRSNIDLALQDIADGTRQWWMWRAMAWQDILQRYRGSMLGPFWLTISMSVMIGALGFLYSQLFRIEISTYLPFLCVGLIVWTMISTILQDACSTFIGVDQIVRQIKLPYTVHAYRVVCRNLIIAAHNIVVYAGVVILFDIPVSATMLVALAGVALILFNGFWVSIILGMVCGRFRDVPQIVASVIQIAFFVTPVIWRPELLQERGALALWNPLFGFIDLVRAPLLNQMPHPSSWITTLTVTAVGGVAAFYIFARFRARIPYWA